MDFKKDKIEELDLEELILHKHTNEKMGLLKIEIKYGKEKMDLGETRLEEKLKWLKNYEFKKKVCLVIYFKNGDKKEFDLNYIKNKY